MFETMSILFWFFFFLGGKYGFFLLVMDNRESAEIALPVPYILIKNR